MNLQQLMLSYPTRFRSERRGSTTGLFYFEISGQGATNFSILLDASGCKLLPGKSGTPACTIKTDRLTLLQLENRDITLQEALSNRRIELSDTRLFQGFIEVFRPLLLKQPQ